VTQRENQTKQRPLNAVLSQPGKRRVTLERTYEASLKDIWALWTTQKGFESWWGPEGFTVKVRKLDLRPGGDLCYDMIAIGPEQIQFMKDAGMASSTPSQLTYSEIDAMKRLAFTHLIDFVPEVEAYNVETKVELYLDGNRVRMVVKLDPMHNEEWTDRTVSGWESQLTKLDKVFRGLKNK